MKKKLPLILSLVLAATLASAASVHLKGGKNAEPSFFDTGLGLATAGELSGLGNGDVLITMAADANVVSTCTNQGGQCSAWPKSGSDYGNRLR